MKILKTERLKLHSFNLLDAIDVQNLVGDFEVADTTLFISHSYKDGMAK